NAESLFQRGCCVSIIVLDQNTPPNMRSGFALVDTGANINAIREDIADALGLKREKGNTGGMYGDPNDEIASNVKVYFNNLELGCTLRTVKIIGGEKLVEWNKKYDE